jgi:DNA-binding ferritin-like protein (Dps family)
VDTRVPLEGSERQQLQQKLEKANGLVELRTEEYEEAARELKTESTRTRGLQKEMGQHEQRILNSHTHTHLHTHKHAQIYANTHRITHIHAGLLKNKVLELMEKGKGQERNKRGADTTDARADVNQGLLELQQERATLDRERTDFRKERDQHIKDLSVQLEKANQKPPRHTSSFSNARGKESPIGGEEETATGTRASSRRPSTADTDPNSDVEWAEVRDAEIQASAIA